ncbi:MAG: LysM peptidoglycan-binding domain-containing protein [bacterium]
MGRVYYAILVLVFGLLVQGCATTNSASDNRTGLNITKQTQNVSAVNSADTQGVTLSTGTVTSASSLTVATNEQDISDVLEHSSAPPSLENITTETDIPMVMNEKVQYFIDYFSQTQHDIFAKWLERSEQYIPQMKKILKENGLPEDLVYMALIESGFNTHAISRSRACGPWQFIKSTAKLYNLKVNWWVDERRNPEKSTLAAARYLKNLYDTFGSWYLAEAAYNAGPIKIMRAMQRQKTDNFWKLAEHRYLRKETRDYVPKLIAAAMIAKNPAAYGFTDLTYDRPIEDDKVVLHHQIDLHVAARLAHTSYEEIKRLNPELLRWATPPVPSYTLNIPAGTKQMFLAGLEKLPPGELFSYKRYVVKSGDTLYMIARAYGVPVHELRVMNHIRNVRELRPGHNIIIPVSPYAHKEVVAYHRRLKTINASYNTHASSKYIYYRVKQGDTLWDIAQRFDVAISKIKYDNNLRGKLIKPNMILKIPKNIAREG